MLGRFDVCIYSCLFLYVVDERRLKEFDKNTDEDSAGLLLLRAFDGSTRLLLSDYPC